MTREHGFNLAVSLVFIEVLAAYMSCFSKADTGVLLERKDSDISWHWKTSYKLGPGSGWSREGNTGRYVVCDIPTTLTNHTNSWLVSDFIQSEGVHEVVTSLTFTTRQCPIFYPYCVQYFKLFAFFTDNQLPGDVPVNFIQEGKLNVLGNVSASVTWNGSVTPHDNTVNVTFLLPMKGLYLALQDIGACISLRKVTVTYKYCPLVTSNGVTYNQTFSPALRDRENSVKGTCLANASGYPRSTILVGKCLANGDWKIDNRFSCLCNPGYEMHLGKCRGCSSGTYKSSHGNYVCRQCASHTHPAMSRDKCDCDSGYYRTIDDPTNSSCTVPPSAPVHLIATIKAKDVVIVIWLPPISNGGRDDITYDVICQQCISSVCDVLCNGVSFWPANQSLAWTHVTISGVTSKVSYCITVLAKNGVSDLASVSYHSNASVMVTIPEYTNVDALAKGTTKEMANISSKVNTAIGVSVACTFLFCLIVGIVITACFIHKQRNRVLFYGNEKPNNFYQQQRKESHTTNETELQSLQREGTLNSSSGNFKVDNSSTTPAVPDVTLHAWCHDKCWEIPVIKLPESECETKAKNSSAMSVRSWFPQENIQYGV